MARETRETVAPYAEYERFLDAELKQAYGGLAVKLDAAARKLLGQSQER